MFSVVLQFRDEIIWFTSSALACGNEHKLEYDSLRKSLTLSASGGFPWKSRLDNGLIMRVYHIYAIFLETLQLKRK